MPVKARRGHRRSLMTRQLDALIEGEGFRGGTRLHGGTGNPLGRGHDGHQEAGADPEDKCHDRHGRPRRPSEDALAWRYANRLWHASTIDSLP